MRALAKIATAVWLIATVTQTAPASGEPAPFMMRATVDDRVIEGQPLAWASQQILLLGRDGVLYDFDPADAKDSKKFGKGYVGYNSGEMQALVRTEFDRRFDISISTHFIVVRPRGRGGDWARRLETLYSGFHQYMSVRGFRIEPPATPLVAIVFPNRQEYYDYAAAQGTDLIEGILGHYDRLTNRMYLYDIAEGDSHADSSENVATIIHEATHQTAYNVGVHARFAEQPRWLAEGLAMMFEAPGVWSAAAFDNQADRINRERLDHFRETNEKWPADWMLRLVAGDRAFESHPLDAYAAAWTLSFYLCETRPQEYSSYLARVAARKPFTEYPPAARVADFTQSFGADFELLTAQLQRFVGRLP